ncbi:MAG: CoB--CoM heterodisulfide reductase iron-sulfur subunit A family protein [Spirochaetales bacterium]|nr:CoB--CoM heterodisulfide reductase iron-sulfur subunit A family protein [Spirochaetales bacterium]
MKKKVLVIGAGIAGISAALELAKCDFYVYLLEKNASIGGWVSSFTCKAHDKCTKCSVCVAKRKIREVLVHPDISILTNSTLKQCHGEIGHFDVEIEQNPMHTDQELQEQKLAVHAIIPAIGFELFDVKQYGRLGYGRYRGVLTGFDLEKTMLENGNLHFPVNNTHAPSIAFIQCAGSRNDNNNYCSRVCCKYAMRFALLIKHLNPAVSVTIFFIDIQNAGKGFAPVYEECVGSIQFIRGIPVEVIENPGKRLEVRYENIAQGNVKRDVFDFIILSAGIVPRPGTWDLARKLGINLDEYGFFGTTGTFNSNDTNVKGIFTAGSCQGPKDIPDTIAHGIAAAERIVEVFAK